MEVNWVDLVIVAVVLYYVVNGWEKGFIQLLANLIAFLGSLWLAIHYHGQVGGFFVQKFGSPSGWSNVLGYLTIALVSSLFLDVLLDFALSYLPKKINESRLNKGFGIAISICTGFVLVSFFLMLTLALPLRGTVKADIRNSSMAKALVTLADQYGGSVKSSLTDLAKSATKFLTIEPGSSDRLNLDVPREQLTLTVDGQAEAEMLLLVNEERRKEGLKDLVIDNRMIPLARAKSRDMFEHSYFSHPDLQGRTADDHMDEAGVPYQVVGENLAYAPDTPMAHEGLMNSPGHRANILDPGFGRIAIGVIDGGYYGKMYTQLFAD